jgi:BlaI family transcriptional regulator, penicillinase repressor
MKKKPSEQLPPRYREILHAVFALGNRASAEEIRAHLHNPPGYSAVRAMLVRLENRGYLKHQTEGVRYVYSATTSPGTARRAALQPYLRTFFGGSMGRMMTALLQQEDWTDEELDALHAEIERVRKERKQR